MSVSGMSTSKLVIRGTPDSLWTSKQGHRVKFNACTADTLIRVSHLADVFSLQSRHTETSLDRDSLLSTLQVK